MPANVVHPLEVPSLLIVGTAARIGKTVIAAAVADYLSRDRQTVGVFKPFDTFCEHRREGWVSEDAEFLAAASKTHHPLDLIAPIRSSTKQPPALGDGPVAWELVDRAGEIISRDSDVMVIEATPGLLDPISDQLPIPCTHGRGQGRGSSVAGASSQRNQAPLPNPLPDYREREHADHPLVGASLTMLDIVAQLRTRAVLVTQASQPLHEVLIHLLALKCASIPVAGVVINKYPPGTATASEETFLRSIEKLAKTRVLAIVPDEAVSRPFLPAGIVEAVGKVDWLAIAKGK